jgi:hypothetical protein
MRSTRKALMRTKKIAQTTTIPMRQMLATRKRRRKALMRSLLMGKFLMKPSSCKQMQVSP